ncbi:exodeoxyribonuclease V subunit gamma [Moraxella lincolnii]|uniref:exodeoxyribonuclease V subunit gamma n=1 Tax=Lwoffella lincolnii TaxID=90241 RepID=UPI0030CE4E12
MLNIYQSNQTEQLLKQLLHAYQSDDIGMFEPFVVLVPSMVLGEWLQNRIADETGISTLITTEFWGRYQWQIMKRVIDAFNDEQDDKSITVPEVAMLSTNVMQWRLFAYLLACYQQYLDVMADLQSDKGDTNQINSLFPLFAKVYALSNHANMNVNNANTSKREPSKAEEQQLWQLAQSLAGAFNRYLTHRNDWLMLWTKGQAVDIKQLIAQKDWLNQQFDEQSNDTPDWIQDGYVELELAQRCLWQVLFADSYGQRQKIEQRFWQGLRFFSQQHQNKFKTMLPKRLYLFTIQQMPLNELDFIRQLSTFIDIELLFYNPSQAYWADIVDKRWLTQQQITNPSMAYVRDFGHTLLSRLGKQSRDIFASLVNLSGNVAKNQRIQANQHAKYDSVTWQDDFVSYQTNHKTNPMLPPSSLLHRLQEDVLIMDDTLTRQYIEQRLLEQSQTELTNQLNHGVLGTANRQWHQGIIDNSLSIHSCHNLQRQLEVMRAMIAQWLNAADIDNNDDDIKTDKKNKRHLSDVLVLLPDVDRHHDLIQSVFSLGEGIDGLNLPAKVTGVVDRQIRSLWQAIVGYYQLLGQAHADFGWSQVFDWLMLPEVYEAYGLGYRQMQRGCELLRQAGFIRGFDETHLRQNLHPQDDDHRFCFAYALDRLVTGLLMPKAHLTDMIYHPVQHHVLTFPQPLTLPLAQITLNDAPIISALCQIYQALAQHRHDYQRKRPAIHWLNAIENDIIHRYFALFDGSKSMRAIFTAINALKKSLNADKSAQQSQGQQTQELSFRLEFLLQSIQAQLESQQISAEPTGVITFARFGALRTVPYKLVVMLNMDISEFPRQERDDYLDLMKAGLARRGDKRSDDEDNGAFLDALLCAKEACWIFYNGQQMGDDTEHLPAQPVSELIQFLQAEVDWQFDQPHPNSQNLSLQSEIKKVMQEHILSSLVTKHSALPYDASVFEISKNNKSTQNNQQNKTSQADNKQAELAHLFADTLQKHQLRQKTNLPPAPIWQQIYHALYDKQDQYVQEKAMPVNAIALPDADEYQQMAHQLLILGNEKTKTNLSQILASDAWHLSVVELLRRFKHPAKHYLKQQQIALRHAKDKADTLEPMVLDNLANYQLTDHLLEHYHVVQDADIYNDVIQNDVIQNPTVQDDTKDDVIAMLLNNTLLPVGVNRVWTLSHQMTQLQQQFDAFMTKLHQSQYADLLPKNTVKHITSVREQQVVLTLPQLMSQLPQQTPHIQPVLEVTVYAKLPSQPKDKLWLNVLAKKDHAKHKLDMWLHHLLWQIARQDGSYCDEISSSQSVAGLAGTSIWQFKGESVWVLPPMTSADATTELQKWLLLAQWLDNHVMVMMPKHAFIYLDKLDKHNGQINKEQNNKEQSYTPTVKDFSDWLKSDSKQNWVADECSKSPVWQYVLADYDDDAKFNALSQALQKLAKPMYGKLYETMMPLDTAT